MTPPPQFWEFGTLEPRIERDRGREGCLDVFKLMNETKGKVTILCLLFIDIITPRYLVYNSHCGAARITRGGVNLVLCFAGISCSSGVIPQNSFGLGRKTAEFRNTWCVGEKCLWGKGVGRCAVEDGRNNRINIICCCVFIFWSTVECWQRVDDLSARKSARMNS